MKKKLLLIMFGIIFLALFLFVSANDIIFEDDFTGGVKPEWEIESGSWKHNSTLDAYSTNQTNYVNALNVNYSIPDDNYVKFKIIHVDPDVASFNILTRVIWCGAPCLEGYGIVYDKTWAQFFHEPLRIVRFTYGEGDQYLDAITWDELDGFDDVTDFEGHTIGIEVQGNTIKGYLDSTEILSATHDTHTNGTASVYSNPKDGVFIFDDFKIYTSFSNNPGGGYGVSGGESNPPYSGYNYTNVTLILEPDYTAPNYTNVTLVLGEVDVYPTITLNMPIDNANLTSQSVIFNCSASHANLANVTLWGNWTGTWTANETNSSGISGTYIFTKTISDGTYIWNCLGCDDSNMCAFAENNRTFNIDSTVPTCSLISITPSDIEANSTGDFEAIINCTDIAGINASSFLITRTVDGFKHPGTPNYWSIRPPENNEAENHTEHNIPKILKADGRWDDKWYDFAGIFADNFTYAVNDNSSIRVTVTTGDDWALLNYTWKVEPTAFRSSLPLSRNNLEAEDKTNQEYNIYRDNYLLVKYWDLETMRNETNYTIRSYRNINYTDAPNSDLTFYYCNSSYNLTGGIAPNVDTDNCVFANSLDTTDLDNIYYSSRNSSYSESFYAVINGLFAGVKATDTFYVFYRSLVPSGKSYNFRYVNGSSGTNVSFADSQVAWISTDSGETWIQANFTPDAWFSAIKDGDEFNLGIYVEDNFGNNYTNFTFVHDDIGDVDHPITSPNIEYIYSKIGKDYDINGTHGSDLTIRVGISINPDVPGTVNHSLYLANTDGSINYTINESFHSADDSDVNITFDTTSVADGTYKLNITATADDNPNDIQSLLTTNNFTIDNTHPSILIVYPENNSYLKADADVNYTVSDNHLDSCWYSNDTYSINITLVDCANITDIIWTEGNHNVTVWANDTAGNENSSSVTFFIDATFPLIIWEDPTPEDGIGTPENYVYLNTTITDMSNTSAFFDWNKSVLGYWNFDYYNSTGLFDNSSYNNFGIFNGLGVSNITDGIRGKALEFDGTNDYINFGNILNFERTDTFSISLWYKYEPTGIDGTLVSKLDSGAGFPGWHTQLDAENRPTIILSNTWGTNWIVIKANTAVNDTTWHHIMFTYDGSSNKVGTKIYIDGVSDENYALSDPGTLSASILNSKDMQIGAYDGTNFPIKGTIDEVVIHNRNLSAEEAGASYNVGAYRLFNNFTSLLEGLYNYSVYAMDSVGNLNITQDRQITVDQTYPQITIIYPVNSTIYAVNVSELNYTYVELNPDKCWYSKDGGASNSTPQACTNFTNVVSIEGDNTWIVYMNDTAGNENSSSVTFLKDTLPPTIDYEPETEANNSYVNQSYIYVNVTWVEARFKNITYFLYNASLALVNSTTYITEIPEINWTNLTDGIYYYNVTIQDVASNSNSTETRKIILDTILPSIEFVNGTTEEGVYDRTWIFVNVTANDTHLDTIVIYLYNSTGLINSTSISNNYSLSINFTNLTIDRNYYLNATANDTLGHINYTETRLIQLFTIYEMNITLTTNDFIWNATNSTGIFEPINQTDSIGILLVENIEILTLNVTIKLNETYPWSLGNITVYVNDEYNYSTAEIVNTDWLKVILGLAVNDTNYIWMWANYTDPRKVWFPEIEILGSAL